MAAKRSILKILKELLEGAKNCELVKKYNVSKSTISTILKNKEKITSSEANSTVRKRLRKATYADVEDALLKCDAISGTHNDHMISLSKGWLGLARALPSF
ncbi:hypothetical protein V5799_009488 [Amblyomma americanum]|uniref:HTH psq-type domain-containing protein n=1 Tax=Amblyomma americanum TaxID=6943 RepID=A0AAQ4FBV8_AMBAM